jgi:glycosyltransferase involved in cell wall biosynthesis
MQHGNGHCLRVLVLCYELPPVGGGGGRVALEVAKGLVRRGHDVRILTSRVGALSREDEQDGVSIRRAFAFRRRPDRCSMPEMAGYISAQVGPAARELARFRPDVVHVHFAVPTGVVAWAATRIHRIPYLLTAHLGDVPGGVPEQTDVAFRFLKPFTVPIWRDAHSISAVSSHVARLAELAYGVRPKVIRNGISIPAAMPIKQRSSGRPLRLVWAGRMQQQKNLANGIRGLGHVAHLPWELDVIGDGPESQNVRAACAEAGASSRVHLHGWLSADRVRVVLDQADVLFLPSLSEGLSLSTVEALRSGLACIATRIPGVDDVIEDGGNGILCDQPREFGDALARLVDDPDLLVRMQAESRRRAPAFDSERMVDGYENLLQDAATRRLRSGAAA